MALAERTRDTISKGNAYLRAHNYQRTAEFMLPPADPKRPSSWRSALARFDKGLATLGVHCEHLAVPYQGGHLRAHYFPGAAGAEHKPLIALVRRLRLDTRGTLSAVGPGGAGARVFGAGVRRSRSGPGAARTA